MTHAREIAAHLPYLRRYGRALTGSQIAGDAYVRATLQAILDGEAVLGGTTGPRVSLYTVFHAIWASAGARLGGSIAVASVTDARLQRLTPRDRQSFLLSTMEGFSLAEIASILGITYFEVQSDIASAQASIDEELKTRVLVIEDEPIIAMDIEALVTDLGHHVAGVATTRAEAVALALAERPGLVLADIQLADNSSGIDAVNDILAQLDVPVIFITAFPERLLSGERPEPTYLITKPFSADTVKATIGQALFFHGAAA